MVIKGGAVSWAQMGDPNASIPTPEPVEMRPMFASKGAAASACSVAFVSTASLADGGPVASYGLKKRYETNGLVLCLLVRCWMLVWLSRVRCVGTVLWSFFWGMDRAFSCGRFSVEICFALVRALYELVALFAAHMSLTDHGDLVVCEGT